MTCLECDRGQSVEKEAAANSHAVSVDFVKKKKKVSTCSASRVGKFLMGLVLKFLQCCVAVCNHG